MRKNSRSAIRVCHLKCIMITIKGRKIESAEGIAVPNKEENRNDYRIGKLHVIGNNGSRKPSNNRRLKKKEKQKLQTNERASRYHALKPKESHKRGKHEDILRLKLPKTICKIDKRGLQTGWANGQESRKRYTRPYIKELS